MSVLCFFDNESYGDTCPALVSQASCDHKEKKYIKK